MEVRSIIRVYDTLLLYFKRSCYNEKKYFADSEEFLDGLATNDADITIEKANELKRVFILHCEELLHIIASYYKLLTIAMPAILFVSTIILHGSKPALIVLGVVAFVSACLAAYLKKKWRLTVIDYTTEITVINSWVNKYHGLGIDVDFNRLGEQYLNGRLK
jgi:hypothetical protein